VSVAGITTAEIAASGRVPELDLDRELAAQKACLEAAEAGLLLSAHDCADGGLAVALAESCFSSLGREAIGAEVDLHATLHETLFSMAAFPTRAFYGVPTTIALFSESPSRIVITFDRNAREAIHKIAQTHNAPFAILGEVGGAQLKIAFDGKELITAEVADLESTWRAALADKLQAELVTG
jgi:phosphoribosylformylglycinamidine synthase